MRCPLVLGGLLVVATHAAWAQPRISFHGSQVIVDGLSQGSDTAWIAVWRERPDWLLTIERRDGIGPDSDRDGRVEIDLERDVPLVSIWAAIDLSTGEFCVETPPGMPRRELDFPADGLLAGPGGLLELLQFRWPFLEVLIARPGVGAWALSTGDGGESDSDGQPDGVTRPALSSFRGVAQTAAAATDVRAGDIVLVIDPDSLEFALRRHRVEPWPRSVKAGE